jgi:adenylate kinase
MNKFVLIGPPGSGKGTQAGPITDAFNIPHISTGEIIRDEVKRESALGKIAVEYSARGELAPDEVIVEILTKRLENPDTDGGYLLDGVPRTVQQAEFMDAQNIVMDKVIGILLEDSVAAYRLIGRAECKPCDKGYNYNTGRAPRVKGVCDLCEGDLYVRNDDTDPKIVENRLGVYHRETEPLLSMYPSISVNGNQPVEVITREILGKLGR